MADTCPALVRSAARELTEIKSDTSWDAATTATLASVRLFRQNFYDQTQDRGERYGMTHRLLRRNFLPLREHFRFMGGMYTGRQTHQSRMRFGHRV